jgi:ABC-type branched-subunit amino acid transport system ATPase component
MPDASSGTLATARRSGGRVAGPLQARDLKVHFDGVKAIDGVDLDLHPGEILGLIGPNGAGKTTCLNALSGFQKPTAGSVILAGDDITAMSPQRRVGRGVSRTFQAVRLFRSLTVFENVELGAVGTGSSRRAAREMAEEIVASLGLESRAHMDASALPHGEERRLGIARALATRPSFLLLDEPAAGLNEVESDELMRFLADLPSAFDCGLLVVEHDMRLIMGLCERIQVLNYGKTICVGTPDEIRQDPDVITAYLGTGRSD